MNQQLPTCHVDGAIVMFDLTSQSTYEHTAEYIDQLRQTYGDKLPIVACGNKVDVIKRIVRPNMITVHKEKHCPYYVLSAKSNYNFMKPFVYLAKAIFGKQNLVFTDPPSEHNGHN
jgi:GTP-binding nuclear protein Ran